MRVAPFKSMRFAARSLYLLSVLSVLSVLSLAGIGCSEPPLAEVLDARGLVPSLVCLGDDGCRSGDGELFVGAGSGLQQRIIDQTVAALGGRNRIITSDYPHYLRETLETRYPGSVLVFLAGTLGGLMNPLNIPGCPDAGVERRSG